MPDEARSPKSSLRNNIMIAFFLVITIGGVSISAVFQHVLQTVLIEEGLDKGVVEYVMKHFIIISTGLTSAGIFIILLIAAFLSNSITKQIKKLTKGVKVVTQGELDVKIDVEGQDEFGQLAEFFNNMTQNLRKTTTSMTNLNKEIANRKKIEKNQEALIRRLEKNQGLLEEQKQALEDSRKAIKNVAEDLGESKHALQEKKKTLEETNKELDDFTYIISHDLKEPLRSIDAFSKFVVDDYKDKLDEQARDYLERVRNNAERMQELIEDLLEISRIERKKNPFEEIEIKGLLNDIKLRFEYGIEQKNVEIIVQDKLPKVFCDRVRMTEVFGNLISNAIKFNDKKQPRIEIGCSRKGVFYEFYVKDNGPGVSEEYYEKIFQIFQRLGKKEDHEGTGAGLTIVKKIVEMHGGRIWVESKEGEYTTFYFTIPAEKGFITGSKKIGEILTEKKLVTKEDIENALTEQKWR